jgi:hypothetical protein
MALEALEATLVTFPVAVAVAVVRLVGAAKANVVAHTETGPLLIFISIHSMVAVAVVLPMNGPGNPLLPVLPDTCTLLGKKHGLCKSDPRAI